MANNEIFVANQKDTLMDHVIEFLPSQHLLKARLINKEWNNRILQCSAFPFIKIGKNWEDKDKNCSLMNLQRCHNFILSGLRLHSTQRKSANQLLNSPYWPNMETHLTTLTLHNITVGCLTLAQFINTFSILKTLVLDCIQFKWETKDGLVPAELKVGLPTSTLEGVFIKRKYHCCHDAPIFGDKLPKSRTIKKIVLRKLRDGILPYCLVVLLTRRSHGTLQEFEFSQNTWTYESRRNVMPAPTDVNTYISTLLVATKQSLRKLTIDGNTNGDELLARIQQFKTNTNTSFNQLEHLKLGQLKPIENDNTIADRSEGYIQFIQDAQRSHPLQSLDLNLYTTNAAQNLEQVLGQCTSLRKLALALMNSNAEVNLGEITHELQHLKELVVKMTGPQSPLNWDFYYSLPASLRKMTIGYETDIEPMNPRYLNFILLTPNLELLTKLVFIQGTGITDELVQLIIGNLTLLEELTINDADQLTDSGLTGLQPNICSFILRKDCLSLLKKSGVVLQTGTGRNLKRLPRLHLLNLKGCKNVTDITLHEAIESRHFTELNVSHLNVSDLGLYWLCEKNPNLERIVCMNNSFITHFGINFLIQHFKNLTNIHTSKETLARKLDGLSQEQPRFKDVVTVAKWNEKA